MFEISREILRAEILDLRYKQKRRFSIATMFTKFSPRSWVMQNSAVFCHMDVEPYSPDIFHSCEDPVEFHVFFVLYQLLTLLRHRAVRYSQ